MSIEILDHRNPYDDFTPTVMVRKKKSALAVQQATRWALNFNGVNTFGQFVFKPIYVDGDQRVVSFKTGPNHPANRSSAVLSHSAGATNGTREFLLVFNSNNTLSMNVGGSNVGNLLTSTQSSTEVSAEHAGSRYSVSLNGVQVSNQELSKGSSRLNLLNIQTTLGASMTSAEGTNPSFFYQGFLFDFRINDTFWPLNEPNQLIQLPVPSGLAPELILYPIDFTAVSAGVSMLGNLINFSNVGSWGGCNVNAAQPLKENYQYLVEFDVSLVSGRWGMRLGIGGITSQLFEGSVSGRQRFLVTASFGNKGVQLFSRQAGSSFTISNLSLRALYDVAANTEVVKNGTFDTSTTSWGGNNLSAPRVVDGRIEFSTIPGQAPQSRVEQALTLDPGSWYLVTGDFIGATNNQFAEIGIIRNAAGTYRAIRAQRLTAPGKFHFIFRAMDSDAIISLRGSTSPSEEGTVTMDNISMVKIQTLCNPIVLQNVVPEQWQQVPL